LEVFNCTLAPANDKQGQTLNKLSKKLPKIKNLFRATLGVSIEQNFGKFCCQRNVDSLENQLDISIRGSNQQSLFFIWKFGVISYTFAPIS
jgi:hypothetical protein